MNGAVATFEKQLQPYATRFADVLAPFDMGAPRFMRGVLTNYENTPTLHSCSLQDVINAAQSAAFIGVTVDGLTGQAWIAPFKDRRNNRVRAQLMIGYRGYCTIAARSQMSIYADVVREGDGFKFRKGTRGFLDHEPKLGAEGQRPILAAWAKAEAYGRPPIWTVMSMDQLLAIRDRAPSMAGASSPWKTDFAGMARKTPVRDLARFLPLTSFTMAAQMEALHEHHGVAVHLTPPSAGMGGGAGGEIVMETTAPLDAPVADPGVEEAQIALARAPIYIHKAKSTTACVSIADWRAKMMMAVDVLSAPLLRELLNLNAAAMAELEQGYPGDVLFVRRAVDARLKREDHADGGEQSG